jgi:hypothetical protein
VATPSGNKGNEFQSGLRLSAQKKSTTGQGASGAGGGFTCETEGAIKTGELNGSLSGAACFTLLLAIMGSKH